ncbi:MAG: phospholipase D-like domain-containing protein [Gemmatimonadota bacterium]
MLIELPILVTILGIILAAFTSAHAVLHKREERAAIGWVGLIWLVPILGPALYVTLGINRIRRRAVRLRSRGHPGLAAGDLRSEAGPGPDLDENVTKLGTLVGNMTGVPSTPGNKITPLVDGDEAFPAMLETIEAAQNTIGMCTYIFDHDEIGVRFIEALERAVRRGVEVRVLVDAVGARYSRPRTPGVLRHKGVPTAEFLKSLGIMKMPYLNLRNHRKILVADGRIGFTGGINVRAGCLRESPAGDRIRDTHFCLQGPIVRQLTQIFAEDWEFTTGEPLSGESWFPPLQEAGQDPARAIPDGPDDDLGQLRWVLLAAIGQARKQIRILTPYFLPDRTIYDSLYLASMRGVEVEIILPESSNLRIVQWAMTADVALALAGGCRVWLSPAPFDHSKIMTVDGEWSLFGSGNWDPRSLRLNFEFNVECYGRELAGTLDGIIDDKMRGGRLLTPAMLDSRRLPIRLRDGVARLFKPYL